MSEVDLSVSREAIAEAARRAVVFQSSPAMEAIAEAVRRAVVFQSSPAMEAIAEAVRRGAVFQSSPAMEAIAEAVRRAAGFASSWTQLAKAFERARRPLPPNLLGVKGLGVEDLQRLADEGITLWAVPR